MSTSTRAARLTVLALLVVSTTAVAQGARPRARFGAGLGLTAPTGDFHADALGDGFNIGWQGLAYVDLRSPDNPLGFRGEVSYGENGANQQLRDDVAGAVGQSIGIKMKMSSANVSLVYHMKRGARGAAAYGLGGVGVYRPALSVSAGGVTADSSTSKFGWSVGGGVKYATRKAATFLELRYCSVAEAFGTKLSFFALRAGLTF